MAVGDRLTGEGMNWNRDMFQNPAMELLRDARETLVFDWTRMARKTWAFLTPPAGELSAEYQEWQQEAFNEMVDSWRTAISSTLSIGVRLAHQPYVAPYQEWIAPALRETQIKIIREVTPKDMENPRDFANQVARIYEVRQKLQSKSKDKFLNEQEERILSLTNSYVSRMNRMADKLKDVSDPSLRQMYFRQVMMLTASIQNKIKEEEK
jgi:hypothetical protein